MREILFRGKRIDNGEWAEGAYLPVTPENYPAIGVWNALERYWWWFEVDPNTVGQYTGLDDKNGQKLFEGNIVDILCENEETGVIEWSEDTARFIVSADGFQADFDNYYGTDLEVIGNIHDNPELLKEAT